MNRSTWDESGARVRRMARRAWVLGVALAALVALPCSASASLAGDVSSVEVDRARMSGVLHVAEAAGHSVHEIRLPGGTRVREYVSSSGTVFGIAWQGPFKPDVQQLLGPYFDEFQEAARVAKTKQAGRGPLLVDQPDLVVHIGGRSRAFFGRAYVPALLPADLSAADIQ